MEKINRKELVAQYSKVSAQYGHLKKSWNPKMAPYILGSKHGYHILDLQRSAQLLKLAGSAVKKKALKGGSFLFVGTDKVSSFAIKKYALQSNSFYVNFQWLGGTFTNSSTLKERVEKLQLLESAAQKNFPQIFSKKEKAALKKELNKLSILFDGIKCMHKLPAAVIFACPLINMIAVKECIKLGIPTIAICDTNSNPELFTYPIPSNDDSVGSIDLILSYLSTKINEGGQLKSCQAF